MSSPPPPDQAPPNQVPPNQALPDQVLPDKSAATDAYQRGRSGFDYLLLIGTSVLFLAYFPIFGAVPRLVQHHLTELDLLWALPLLLISACMLVLWSWVLLGVTIVGRLIWIVLLALAALAYPAAIVGLFTMTGVNPGNRPGGPPPPPPPVWVEPAKP